MNTKNLEIKNQNYCFKKSWKITSNILNTFPVISAGLTTAYIFQVT